MTPGHVLHDRLAPTEDPVDQGGLADVGPADDRDDRQVGRRAEVELVGIQVDPELLGRGGERGAFGVLVHVAGRHIRVIVVTMTGRIVVRQCFSGGIDVTEGQPASALIISRRSAGFPRDVGISAGFGFGRIGLAGVRSHDGQGYPPRERPPVRIR